MKTHKLMANNTLKKVLTMNKLKIQRAKGNLQKLEFQSKRKRIS